MAGGPGEGTRAVAHRQRQAVEGAHLQAVEIGGALLHLGPGPHVVGHQANRRGRHAQVPYQPPGPLGEHARLSRSGRRHDAGPASEVAHSPPLVGRQQVSRGLARAQRRQAAHGEVGRGDQSHTPQCSRVERVQGPAVAPQAGAVVGDVASLARGRWACTRIKSTLTGCESQPSRIAGIHCIGRQQVMPDLVGQREAGTQLPPRPVQHRLGARQRAVHLDHQPFTALPRRSQPPTRGRVR